MEMSTSTSVDSTESLPTSPEVLYLALRDLKIPNGPGKVPSSVRIPRGVRFELDGDEPINLQRLLNSGAAKLYESGTADDELIKATGQAMAKAAAKPRIRRSRSKA
jgi:hypothetical protein